MLILSKSSSAIITELLLYGLCVRMFSFWGRETRAKLHIRIIMETIKLYVSITDPPYLLI